MTKALETIHEGPRVFIKDGLVQANSRDVADHFKKQHGHVLRDIDRLIEQGVSGFGEGVFYEPRNQQTHRVYEMDRDAFSILCMGFTGAKAIQWKLDYVTAFNAMEDALTRPQSHPSPPSPTIDLNDPATLRGALLTYTEKVIALEAVVAVTTPKAQFYDAYADAGGRIVLTDLGRVLGVGPLKLLRWLVERKVLFRRRNGGPLVPFETYLVKGWFTVRTIIVDSEERVQTFATPRGLQGIAEMLGRQTDLFGQIDKSRRLPTVSH